MRDKNKNLESSIDAAIAGFNESKVGDIENVSIAVDLTSTFQKAIVTVLYSEKKK
jgi:hypothetical protein